MDSTEIGYTTTEKNLLMNSLNLNFGIFWILNDSPNENKVYTIDKVVASQTNKRFVRRLFVPSLHCR
jgi:hypothetical protein